LRPIIGNRVVIPHIIIIKRLCIVGEAGAITGGRLRHLLFFLSGPTFVEESSTMFG